jgi:formylglycine-generating enzyme required for sulfatase activity
MRAASKMRVALAAALLLGASGCGELLLGAPSGDGAGGAGASGGSGAAGGQASGGAGGAGAAGAGSSSAGGQGGAGGSGPCALGDLHCGGVHGNELQECDAVGGWSTTELCASVCSDGACVTPPSCVESPTCGENQSCCASYLVEGGTFKQLYDDVNKTDDSFSATVSSFLLDRYEVSVSRFRRWVAVYDEAGAKPAAGSGRNPNNPEDTGWFGDYNIGLPPTAADLDDALLECPGTHWTSAPGVSEREPMACINWFMAQAFCIWDGGRLPTAAERNYAAAGGGQQRVYPWSAPSKDATISSSYAVYYPPGAIAEVGSIVGQGDGRWGHLDLAGNAWEWVQDYWAPEPPTTDCQNCANLTVGPDRAYHGGGYLTGVDDLIVAYGGDPGAPLAASKTIGFRCARTP